MKNRTLVYLTSLVLLAMLALFSLNVDSILRGSPSEQTFLKYNGVRGMAVRVKDKLYTLNFEQQNEIIQIINRAVRLQPMIIHPQEKAEIDQIVVYLFNNQPDIIITPITYKENRMIFFVPEWDETNYFMELSDGKLRQLLSETFDH